jgi:tetratricopeptide (TPR) repeat protein
MKSAALLEKLYAANPQHPGITHYLIHAYDFAPIAGQGIAAARRYAGIAPAVPHARHMPAHIYSMVGLWEDSIASNLSALEIQPDYYHAADFTVYAHLQLAQDAKAAAMIDKALRTPERGDRPALEKSGDLYWAERTHEQILAATAWAALAGGARDKAIALMRGAADGEDGSLKNVAMENRLYPMRELLGDLLLQASEPRQASAEYERALKQNPNRFRGLYGAARAADAAGDRKKATEYYSKLIELAKNGDGARPELKQARAYLAAR